MTTTITITGTGCPIPSALRSGPGVLIQTNDSVMQFDVGRGTTQRLDACKLWPTDLDAVFVTHHHSDHLVGLADLLLTRWIMDRKDNLAPLPIIVPGGPATKFVTHVLDVWHDDIQVRKMHSNKSQDPEINIVSFEVPSDVTEVWSSGEVKVSTCKVRHEPVYPAVGYRIESRDGVVAISGDTLVCDEVAKLAEGADVLIYEAMRFEAIESLPKKRQFILDYHADTRLIGAQAKEIGVGTLVLTHLIPEPFSEEDRQWFIEDIREGGFTGELIVAEDLDSVVLEK